MNPALQKVLAQLKSVLQTLSTVLESMKTKPVMQPPAAPAPQQPAQPTPVSPKGSPTRIQQLCSLIQTYEGWIAPGGSDAAGNVYPQGSPAFRNKNPGNIRCAPADRETWPASAVSATDSGFCVFETYESGMATLDNNITAICLGTAAIDNPYQIAAKKLGLTSCKYLTLDQFFEIRDPESDGNKPNLFSQFVGKGMGVDNSTFRMCDMVA